MSRKLIILQTVLPDYRRPFFEALRNRLTENFELYGGETYFETSIKTSSSIQHTKITNLFLCNRRFLWQKRVLRLATSSGTLVVELNPRILTNWLLLILRRFKGRRTIVWGHAWPRKGKDSPTDVLRNWMRLLATEIIVYTNTQRDELSVKMPNKIIFAAPNSVISKDQMEASSSNSVPKNLIYVGRLTKSKKPLFLVRSFANMIHELPMETNLIIVGEGTVKDEIAELIKKKKLSNRIILAGHINDEQKLKDLYHTSIFSVSPGYVGLSIIQSFSFGVPMLISRDEPHSPEIEAAVQGENAIFYKSDSEESFRESVREILNNKESWLKRRHAISHFCASTYSVEKMAAVFCNLINQKKCNS
ncbi:glycosyltransferase family 4 protein [Dokdonia sp. Hel_I_53]|uniref:glycosyltransferase family 4 protein n=1 Tax=Dokdonia sp. Hel_I_53 TaxID=1566287 RepID=UPI00119B35C4|nr:glycosyltransferase family 4 protein [Dokdonia sp. Hel_I_53]TVZ52664.1 glycosyl transferase family 1 [Dokdonia sp. Hel_I_53]